MNLQKPSVANCHECKGVTNSPPLLMARPGSARRHQADSRHTQKTINAIIPRTSLKPPSTADQSICPSSVHTQYSCKLRGHVVITCMSSRQHGTRSSLVRQPKCLAFDTLTLVARRMSKRQPTRHRCSQL